MDQDLRVPRGGDEDGVDAAADGRQDDLAGLQADEEGIGHDDGGEGAAVVVGRMGELEVEVR